MWIVNENDIKTKNVMACGICGAMGHLMVWGAYECEKNPMHCADTHVGIWTDLTHPDMEKMSEAKSKVMGGALMKHPIEKKLTMFASDMHVGGSNVFPTFEELKKMVAKATEPGLIKFPMVDYQTTFIEKSLPDKISIPPEIMEQFKATMKKWVFTPKLDGIKASAIHDAMEDVTASMEGIVFKPHSPYSADQSGIFVKEKAVEPPKKKSKALPVGVPKVFPPLLSNPRSKWGQKMKEKLEGKG
jgi:hypothetical protein